MSQKIKALIKRADEKPYSTWVSNDLENLQKHVDGYIECVGLALDIGFEVDLCILCDEEGRLKDKPHNCTIRDVSFVGDIVIVGIDGDEWSDIPISWADAKALLPELWEVL